MTDDKDILQALYAACAQAWARFKKRWKGGTSSDKYTASEIAKYFDYNLREVFAYDMKTEIIVGVSPVRSVRVIYLNSLRGLNG